MARLRIVADFGGTNARLAALDAHDRPGPVSNYPAAEFAGPAEVVSRFLSDAQPFASAEAPVVDLAMAIAGPPRGEHLALTNLPWSFSRAELRARLGLKRLEILNDFEALAHGIPWLLESEKLPVKEGGAAGSAPVVVLGPGTGLGVAALVPSAGGLEVVSGEGGHVDLAATNAEEWGIVARLGERFGHVSPERVLSGPGLENLYATLDEPPASEGGRTSAAEIARRSRAGEARARHATELFSAWLGAFAGDLALTFGARGGVYLGGGVLAGLGEGFDAGRFVARFVDKGRMRNYLEPVPVWRILRPDAALLGCAARLRTGGDAAGDER